MFAPFIIELFATFIKFLVLLFCNEIEGASKLESTDYFDEFTNY
jgi:hypothetical protein